MAFSLFYVREDWYIWKIVQKIVFGLKYVYPKWIFFALSMEGNMLHLWVKYEYNLINFFNQKDPLKKNSLTPLCNTSQLLLIYKNLEINIQNYICWPKAKKCKLSNLPIWTHDFFSFCAVCVFFITSYSLFR